MKNFVLAVLLICFFVAAVSARGGGGHGRGKGRKGGRKECAEECTGGKICGRRGECVCPRSMIEDENTGECKSKCNDGNGCGDNAKCFRGECRCRRGYEMNAENECHSKCEPACDGENMVCRPVSRRDRLNFSCQCKRGFVMEGAACVRKE